MNVEWHRCQTKCYFMGPIGLLYNNKICFIQKKICFTHENAKTQSNKFSIKQIFIVKYEAYWAHKITFGLASVPFNIHLNSVS